MRGRIRRAMAAAVAELVSPPASSPIASARPAARSIEAHRRRRRGKRIAPLPVNVTRWYQRDVEDAQHQASQGDLARAGQLYRALRRDGVVQGLLGTRTGGLVRLPKRFAGDPEAVAFFEGAEGREGTFNAIFPASELAMLDADGVVLGVGVGEFVDVEGSPYPVFCRLDPEYLIYRAHEDRWYYRSFEGLLPITPGDGRWVLYTPGGRQEPWNNGLLWALARAYISKEHAFFLRENWNSKLANPARVAVAPQGASQEQKESWFQKVMAWGVNTVFGLTPGYDAKLLESNGRGYESFRQTIEDSNQEFMISVAGQVVTVTGGAGFANANIHATIRADLIQGDAEALAATLNTQALPVVLPEGRFPLGVRATVAWDTRPPANLKSEAESLSAAAKAMDDCAAALQRQGLQVDARSLAARFAIPVAGDMDGDAKPDTRTPQLTRAPARPLPASSTEPHEELPYAA
ncbi:phage portal protein family protein [Sorangium sp. So ce117]|uniref:phage portal protein family protein n=1 Tax=Sorangium sp. So ce117 TaxID=3133277 RepID=UPI003F642A55